MAAHAPIPHHSIPIPTPLAPARHGHVGPASAQHPGREPHARHLVATVLIVLLTLVGLACAGAVAFSHVFENHRVVAQMGPKARLAPLPALDIALGGARAIDVQVSLVLAPTVKADAVLRYQDRIADRLFESVGRVEAERLTAPGSAQLLKDAVKDAVRREAGAGLIRDVYIERMVVR